VSGGDRSLIQKALVLREKVDLCSRNSSGCQHQTGRDKIQKYQRDLATAFEKRLWEDRDQSKAHHNRMGYADICKNYLRYCFDLVMEDLLGSNGEDKSGNQRFCGAMAFFSCVPFRDREEGDSIVRGFINWDTRVWDKKNGQDGGLEDTPLNSGICADLDRARDCPRGPTQEICQNCIGRQLVSLTYSSTPLLDDLLPRKGILHFSQSPLIDEEDDVCAEVYQSLSLLKAGLAGSPHDPLLTGLSHENLNAFLSEVLASPSAESAGISAVGRNTIQTFLESFMFGGAEDTREHWPLISMRHTTSDPWACDNAEHLVGCRHNVTRPDGRLDPRYRFSDFLDIPLSLLVLPRFKNFYAFNVLLSDLSTDTETFSGGGKGSLILYDLENSTTLSAEEMAALFIVANEAMTSLAMYEHRLIVEATRKSLEVGAFRNAGHLMRHRCDSIERHIEEATGRSMAAIYGQASKKLKTRKPDRKQLLDLAMQSAHTLSDTFQVLQLWGFRSLDELWASYADHPDKIDRFFTEATKPIDLNGFIAGLRSLVCEFRDIDNYGKCWTAPRFSESHQYRCMLSADPFFRDRRPSDHVLSAVFYEVLLNAMRYGYVNGDSEELSDGLATVTVKVAKEMIEEKEVVFIYNRVNLEIDNDDAHMKYEGLPTTFQQVRGQGGSGLGLVAHALFSLDIGCIWHHRFTTADDAPNYGVAVHLKGLHWKKR